MFKRAAAVTMLIGAVLLGCTPHPAHPAPETRTVTSSPAPAGPPERPRPAATKPCPYLGTQTVALANGQHVGSVRVSASEAGHPPACFFYRPDGGLQATVWPYRGKAATAHAMIDAAAPVDTSAKASDPPGWTGGEQPTESGAVYAVTKDNAAVVVTTNQRQTIKAREIAEKAISALGW